MIYRSILYILVIISLISCSTTTEIVKTENARQERNLQDKLRKKISEASRPGWIDEIPISANSYFFVGLGEDKDKSKAKNKAIQDALGQVTLLIHTSISSKNSFSSIYEEHQSEENKDVYSMEKEAYTKLEVKGQGSIKDFTITNNYHSTENEITTWYSLASIPKNVIKLAREEIKLLRENLSKTPALIIGHNKIEQKFKSNNTLKDFFQSFYKSQGYTIIEGEIRTTKLDRVIAKAKDKNAKILIYALIEVDRVTKNLGFYILYGRLSVREILLGNEDDLSSNTIGNVYSDKEKGISAESLIDAFYNLETKLIKKLKNEEDRSNTKEDSYLSY